MDNVTFCSYSILWRFKFRYSMLNLQKGNTIRPNIIILYISFHIYDKYWQNLCLSWDLNLRSPVLRTGVPSLTYWDTDTNSESNLPSYFSPRLSECNTCIHSSKECVLHSTVRVIIKFCGFVEHLKPWQYGLFTGNKKKTRKNILMLCVSYY